jgi:hypothetical protein
MKLLLLGFMELLFKGLLKRAKHVMLLVMFGVELKGTNGMNLM